MTDYRTMSGARLSSRAVGTVDPEEVGRGRFIQRERRNDKRQGFSTDEIVAKWFAKRMPSRPRPQSFHPRRDRGTALMSQALYPRPRPMAPGKRAEGIEAERRAGNRVRPLAAQPGTICTRAWSKWFEDGEQVTRATAAGSCRCGIGITSAAFSGPAPRQEALPGARPA